MLSTSEAADVLAIHQLLALHGHLVDTGELDRLDELLTADVRYDVTALGQREIRGIAAFRAATEAFAGDPRNPVAHHVTNVVVDTPVGDRTTVRSKGIGVLGDGRIGSVTYVDEVVRTEEGWRVGVRKVLPR